MKRLRLSLLCALLSLAPALSATTPAPYVWIGLGTGWKGQVTPNLTAGTAQLWLQDSIANTIYLPATVDLAAVKLIDNGDLEFRASGSASSLTLRQGLSVDSSVSFAHLTVGKDVTLKLDYAQTFDVGNSGTLTVYGATTGTANVTFTGSNTNNSNPSLVLANLSGTASTYTGTLTLSSATAGTVPSLTIWNNDSLAAGASLVFTQGGRLSVHNTSALSNTLTLNSGATGTLTVLPRDSALTLSGTVTLANNTTLQASSTDAHSDFTHTNRVTNYTVPGARSHQPLILSGTLAESGGARSLNVTGEAPVILTGTTTITGGISAGFVSGTTNSSGTNAMNAGGAVVFGSLAAIPSSGTIQSGYYNSSLTTQTNNAGYVGIAASVLTANSAPFSQFASAVSATSTGAVGIDTLPGESVTPYAGAIDLTHFTSATSTGIRFGTATKAIVAGTFTPQNNTYAFGNGGGVLTVRSSLANAPTTNVTRNLNLFSNGGNTLGLYLQGTNTYSGGTSVGTGYLVFDGNGALTNSVPLLGSLTTSGSSTSIGTGYIGYTENVASNLVSALATAMGATEFLAKFDKVNTWGVVGFDSSNPNTPVAISNVDLTGFNNGVFLGTVSAAVLKGTLTPTSIVNTANSANTLRLTAGAGGTLTVQSPLADLVSGVTPLQVVVGSPSSETLANGTVVFDPRNSDNISTANTYTGGTSVNNVGGITLAAARSDAFGTGAITLQPHGGTVGLSATAPGLVIGNNIVFASPTSLSGGTSATLAPVGTNDFTLSGSLSGSGWFQLASPANATTPLNVTLAGNNSAFNGTFALQNGRLTLTDDRAAGQALFELSSNAILALGGNALSATLYGLKGNHGSIVLPNATNLTLNLDTVKFDHDFGGTISGENAATTTASLTVTSTSSATYGSQIAYLYGDNRYSGGTSIVGDGAVLALGHNNAAGTGAVTVNVLNGGLILNTGITFINPLQFSAGALAGFGEFAPTSINGDTSATRRFTVGANQMLVPGFPGGDKALPGKLTLANSVTFTTGGTFLWVLQDAFRSDGYSALAINGDLDLTSLTSTSRFTIELQSIDSNGADGLATMTAGDTYQFAIINTSGTIQGFDPTKFVFDTTKFQQNLIDPSQFALATSADSKQLLLSFTAVPEPSTYALFGTGLALLGLAAWRQRRRA